MKVLLRDTLSVVAVNRISIPDRVGITESGELIYPSEVLRVSEPRRVIFFCEHNDAFNKIAATKCLSPERWGETASWRWISSKKIGQFYANINPAKGFITDFSDIKYSLKLYWSDSEQKLYCSSGYVGIYIDAEEYYGELTKTRIRYKKIVHELKKIYSDQGTSRCL